MSVSFIVLLNLVQDGPCPRPGLCPDGERRTEHGEVLRALRAPALPRVHPPPHVLAHARLLPDDRPRVDVLVVVTQVPLMPGLDQLGVDGDPGGWGSILLLRHFRHD